MQRTVLDGLEGFQYRRIYTPQRTVVERVESPSLPEARESPRLSFAGHVRDSKWDHHHVSYFLGYSFWYYLNLPFCFTLPGFKTREVDVHEEGGEEWRVLEVTFPDYVATHNPVQLFYYDKDYQLRRMDYKAQVVSDVVVVKHYCYDHKTFSGLRFPTLRRVHSFSSCSTSFLIDILNIRVNFKDDEPSQEHPRLDYTSVSLA